MTEFGTALARLMTARGLGVRELARMVPCNPGHISNLRSGKARPSPELAATLDERLEAGGTLTALPAGARPPGRG
jgi:transcriptional regulator with XRE-family HTH domain